MIKQSILRDALVNALLKLTPIKQISNPIMFTVYVSALITSCFFLNDSLYRKSNHTWFIFSISLWLWLTIIFANFAEAFAEGRGRMQAQRLRKHKRELMAKKLLAPNKSSKYVMVPSNELHVGDVVLVETGDMIPSDGEVIDGIALVNESAITGESAPVIREKGNDRCGVTGGTQVISDWLVIGITADSGKTFLDKMISLVENAKRHKSPNELALTTFLAALTLVFLVVCGSLLPFSIYSVNAVEQGHVISLTAVIALFVCLSPTTIGGLLSAIGIAGMDRMIQTNMLAFSGKVIETAGNVDILILDKTGTITLGNRKATEFIPVMHVPLDELADAAQLASLADETPEGRSIVVLAKSKYGLRSRKLSDLDATFIPFKAETRISGANVSGVQIRKGAPNAIIEYIKQHNGIWPKDLPKIIDSISKTGGTPLVVAKDNKVLGVIHLKDIVKGGIKDRFVRLRKMGIKTIMVTGDNPLTAAAIAAEAGVDDFLAEAYPEDKLKLIQGLQAQGHLVAMTGDGTNDAPALAQADVAVAMNTGTQAAKEAGNIIDLDSNPTKLIEAVGIGKQLLMTRGSLTTFSLSNDIAKYFAILPAVFTSTYPSLDALNIMRLNTPESAVLSAIIFNAIIILLLIPLALYGIQYKEAPASELLKKNILIYGLGGILVPFLGIKLIDMFIYWLRLL